MSSISSTALLTVGTSAAGILCLSLAELLPWTAFALLMAVHVLVLMRFSARLPLSAPLAMIVSVLVMSFEALRIFEQGKDVVLFALRDLIVFFAMLRLILPKTSRELYQIAGIAITECTLATIVTESMLFLAGLLLLAALVPMLLSKLDESRFGEKARQRIEPMHWAKVLIGIIAIACLLFILIPRPSSTILRQGIISRPQTGFSEEIDLYRTESISTDRSVVMRIIWDQGKAPGRFYLSGARLEKLRWDGFTTEPGPRTGPLTMQESTDRLTIYPTGLACQNVLYPFRLSRISPAACSVQGSNLYWDGETPSVYEVWVHRLGNDDTPGSVQVPDELRDVAELGGRIAGQGTPRRKVRRLTQYLQSHYAYTLEGLAIPRDISPIAWFVFTGRKGNCEHFASALAVMIRGCGIPARVVTGFLVNEFNTSGGYYLVRAENAHAWVEYLDGTWKTVEAVPQDRVSDVRRAHPFDALRFQWIRWVIRYSLDDQVRLMAAIFSPSARAEGRVKPMLAGFACIAALGAVLLLISHLIKQRSAAPYRKVLSAIAKKGLPLDQSAPHETHLAQVRKHWPSLEGAFKAFLDDYLAGRFGGRDIDLAARTKLMIRTVRRSRRPPGRCSGQRPFMGR
ncbi:MAG: transglutaminaseTgpA domain-containing protein [Desulfomonilia bacterium]|uniref:Protein-glutamine gamma-glutamyltransferase n=1 Tax=anaerobic digester metagenome TaxID=1263854 RepID=A0A485M841_9ZZZZ